MKGLLKVAFLMVQCAICHAETESHEIASSARIKIEEVRMGEGSYKVVAKRSGKADLVIWKTYWGRSEARISPGGSYLVIQDVQRFGILSPVIVFRLSGDSVDAVYQTPGNFDLEETGFSYKIESFTDDELGISVYENVWSENSSRPSVGNKIGYKIKLKDLKKIDPRFYDSKDSLHGGGE